MSVLFVLSFSADIILWTSFTLVTGNKNIFWSPPARNLQTRLYWCLICLLSWKKAWYDNLSFNSWVEKDFWIWSEWRGITGWRWWWSTCGFRGCKFSFYSTCIRFIVYVLNIKGYNICLKQYLFVSGDSPWYRRSHDKWWYFGWQYPPRSARCLQTVLLSST